MVLGRVGKLAGVAKLGWWVIGWCSGGLASLLGRLQHSRRCPRSYLATFVGLTLNTSSFVHFLGAFVVRSGGQHVVKDNNVQGIATFFGPALIGLWALGRCLGRDLGHPWPPGASILGCVKTFCNKVWIFGPLWGGCNGLEKL